MRVQTSLLIFIAAAALTGHSAAAAPAYAADEPRQARVTFGDLDLSSQAGAKALGLRLRHAARLVCDDSFSGGWLSAKARCEREAVANARQDIEARRADVDPIAWRMASR